MLVDHDITNYLYLNENFKGHIAFIPCAQSERGI